MKSRRTSGKDLAKNWKAVCHAEELLPPQTLRPIANAGTEIPGPGIGGGGDPGRRHSSRTDTLVIKQETYTFSEEFLDFAPPAALLKLYLTFARFWCRAGNVIVMNLAL